MSSFIGLIISLCIAASANCSLIDHILIKKDAEILLGNHSAVSFRVNLLHNKKDTNSNTTASIYDCSQSKKSKCNYSNGTYLNVSHWTDECVLLNYWTKSVSDSLVASFVIKNVHLYGGPIIRIGKDQDLNWPSEKTEYKGDPYMCIDCASEYRDKNDRYFGAILEPYWLFSNGYYIYVDNRVPLFITSNETSLNLIAKIKAPYQQLAETFLNFTLCKLDDAVEAHRHAIKHFLGKPSNLPDLEVAKQPVWSTNDVTEIKVPVNQSDLINFAEKITENGYGGRIVVRYKWEDYWGSLRPETSISQNFFSSGSPKFTNFTEFVRQMKRLNLTLAFRVHPFVSKEELSEQNRNYTLQSHDRFHWDGDLGHYVDSTNPKALDWLRNRLKNFSKTYGINSFEFDNGVYDSLTVNESVPNRLETVIRENTNMLANLSSNIVSYVARGTQEHGFFVPMHLPSRKPTPSYTLRSIIAHLLHTNILGYSFTMPSIIESDVDHQGEMFIRWVQLCVFMPSMQFSMSQAPWLYDGKIVNLTKKFVDMHANYSSLIIKFMKENVDTGAPVNRPIWWLSPNDPIALGCSAAHSDSTTDGEPEKSVCRSEFLLGDRILVAPVLEYGQRKRNIYLPEGLWKDGNSEKMYIGPIWVKDYPASLSVLPFFLQFWPGDTSMTGIISSSYRVTPLTALVLAISLVNGLIKAAARL